MASKIPFIIFFLTFLLTTQKIHARESQFFNKIPSNNNLVNENRPKEEDPLDKLEQEPTFIPENNQNVGIYGHESGQLPPSTTTTNTATTTTTTPFKNEPDNYEFVPKYLPKNYNTQAYVTEPEGYHPAQESNTNNKYYNPRIDVDSRNPKQGYPYPATTTTAAAANEGGDNYYQNPKQSYPAQETNTNNYANDGEDGYYPATTTTAVNEGDSYYQNPKQSFPATTKTAVNEGEIYYQNPKQSYPAQETNTNNYANDGNDNYYQNPKQSYPATTTTAVNEGESYYQNPKQSYPATTTTAANEGDNYYQKYGGNGYNGYDFGQKGYTTTTTAASSGGKYSDNNNYYNAAAAEKQGMSDTRFLENGKYFYDLSLEKNENHPFDTTTRFNENTYEQFQGLP